MKTDLARCVADPCRAIRGSMKESRWSRLLRLMSLSVLISIVGPVGDIDLAGQTTPPTPSKPWSPPGLEVYEKDLASWPSSDAKIDPDRLYDLPELIDIAESTNPQTRVAWERARQAAAAVGLSKSAYYPYLAASAFAGYEKAFIPFPTLQQGPGPSDVSVVGGGALGFDLKSARVALDMKWLLLRFRGARRFEDHRRGGVDGRERRLQRRPSAGRLPRRAAVLRIQFRPPESRGGRNLAARRGHRLRIGASAFGARPRDPAGGPAGRGAGRARGLRTRGRARRDE